MTYRETGKSALCLVLKNIDKNKKKEIEDLIFNYSMDESDYIANIYQIIGDILNGSNMDDILINIRNKNIGWDHCSYFPYRTIIAEQNDFIQNPIEIEEGVFQCKAIIKSTGQICGNKRIKTTTKQDRNADEGTSVYAECSICKARWRERG